MTMATPGSNFTQQAPGNGKPPEADPWPHDQAVRLGYLVTLLGSGVVLAFGAKVEEVRAAWRQLLPTDAKGAIKVDWRKPSDTPAVFLTHAKWTDFLHNKLQHGKATVADFNAEIERLNLTLEQAVKDGTVT